MGGSKGKEINCLRGVEGPEGGTKGRRRDYFFWMGLTTLGGIGISPGRGFVLIKSGGKG